MSSREETVKAIVQEVLDLRSPKIQETRKDSILDFIKMAVNGDDIKTHLVIDVKLNNTPGVYVYILTNARLIQIQIDVDHGISSLAFVLSGIINVERKLIDDARIEVQVIFKDNVVGLRYSTKDQKTTEFFQQIEQTWAKGGFNDKTTC